MSNGFAFNFLAAADDDDDDDGDLGETAALTSNVVEWAESNANAQRGRFSFDWVDDLGPLLIDRAQEELVYTDIPLNTTASATPIITVAGSTSNGRNDTDNDPDEGTGQRERFIRCIDLSSSSFHVPTSNAPLAKDGSADNENAVHSSTSSDNDEDRIWKETDIQTGIYEGGRKVWECSRDLIEFMVQEDIGLEHGSKPTDNHDDKEDNESKRPFFCLELGCGHGLPGCYLLREALSLRKKNQDGASDFSLVMTDYNRSVVLDATVSNLVLNCLSSHIHESANEKEQLRMGGGAVDPELKISEAVDTLLQHVRIGAGDWMDMSQKLLHLRNNQDTKEQSHDPLLPSDGMFDLILAAETIYSESTARETVLLLQRHLRPGTGVAYVATKRYYFGVGGGVASFRKFASKLNDQNSSSNDFETTPRLRLSIETVRVVDNGTSNIREVLKVQCSYG